MYRECEEGFWGSCAYECGLLPGSCVLGLIELVICFVFFGLVFTCFGVQSLARGMPEFYRNGLVPLPATGEKDVYSGFLLQEWTDTWP